MTLHLRQQKHAKHILKNLFFNICLRFPAFLSVIRRILHQLELFFIFSELFFVKLLPKHVPLHASVLRYAIPDPFLFFR